MMDLMRLFRLRLGGTLGMIPGAAFATGEVSSTQLANIPCDVTREGEERRIPKTGSTASRKVRCEYSGSAWQWSEVGLPALQDLIDIAAGAYTDEQARDAIGAALVAGNNIDITINDPANTITIDVEGLTSADLSDFATAVDERARDALGTALTAGTGITITPNDGADTITVATTITQYTDEMARDALGTALVAGNNIDITVSDVGDTITLAVESLTSADITDFATAVDEQARDALGAALVAGNNIDLTVSDAGDTITIDVEALTAADITSGTFATARLGSGTANSSSYLRGDQTWDTIGIDELNDVAIATPAQGQLLTYDAGSWVNADPQQGIMTLDDRTHAYVSQFGTTGTGNTHFDTPGQVAIDGSGNIYIADTANNRLKKHNSSGTYVTSVTSLTGISGVCVDSGNNVYVAYGTNLRQYNSALVAQWTNASAGIDRHIATDGTYVYGVSFAGTTPLGRFLCSTGAFVSGYWSVGSSDGQLDGPVGITTDGTYLYVVDQGNDRVQKYTISGAYVSQWGHSGSDPGEFQTAVGIHYNSVTETIYVTDSGRDDVQEFTTTGGFVGSFGSAGTGNGEFQDASGIASDVAGSSVWVADATQDRLQKFTRSVTSEEATRVSFNSNDFIVASTDGGETGFISLIRAEDIPDHDHSESGEGGVLGPAALGVIGIYQDADYTGSNVNTAQKIFNESANGAATVAGDTAYLMELVAQIQTTGTTSHNLSLLFGGTATLTSIRYDTTASAASTDNTQQTTVTRRSWNAATANSLHTAAFSVATYHHILIKGLVRINAAGTFIPQFQWSAAPGGITTVRQDSYFQLTPIGSGSVTTVGSWS